VASVVGANFLAGIVIGAGIQVCGPVVDCFEIPSPNSPWFLFLPLDSCTTTALILMLTTCLPVHWIYRQFHLRWGLLSFE
jgi:hypothetical protein